MSDLKGELESLRIDRDPSSPVRRRLWPFLVAALGLVVVSVMLVRARERALAVEVTTVRAQRVPPGEAAPAAAPVLSASGYVVARRKAVVSAKIQGRLAELRVEEGSRVARGDVLARLESRDFRARVALARAEVQRAEADLAESERRERVAGHLAAEDILPADELEVAHSRVRIAAAALAQARAGLSLAEAQLDHTVVRAPFAGVVVKKMAEVGESVAPIPPGVNISTASGAIVALADLDTLEVEVDVAEANVARLAAGQAARVIVEAFPERHYQAVLRQVIPTADRTRATVQVKVTIAEQDADLRPEMSARVDFLQSADARDTTAAAVTLVTVPEVALTMRQGRSVVFELRAGQAHMRSVRVGRREGAQAVIDGLAGGEELIADPPAQLRDGDSVRRGS